MPASEADVAYVTHHHDKITAWFAEAMALVVNEKPSDPIAFLRHHLADDAGSAAAEQARLLELEELRLMLEAERTERQRLEDRLCALERMRDAGSLQVMMEPPSGMLQLHLPSVSAAARELEESQRGA